MFLPCQGCQERPPEAQSARPPLLPGHQLQRKSPLHPDKEADLRLLFLLPEIPPGNVRSLVWIQNDASAGARTLPKRVWIQSSLPCLVAVRRQAGEHRPLCTLAGTYRSRPFPGGCGRRKGNKHCWSQMQRKRLRCSVGTGRTLTTGAVVIQAVFVLQWQTPLISSSPSPCV